MGKVLVTDSYLTDIADAIREKNGTEETYLPSAMAAAIASLSCGEIDGKKVVTGSVVASNSKLITIQHDLGYELNGIVIYIGDRMSASFNTSNFICGILSNAFSSLGYSNIFTMTTMSNTGESYSTYNATGFQNDTNAFTFSHETIMSGAKYYWIAY